MKRAHARDAGAHFAYLRLCVCVRAGCFRSMRAPGYRVEVPARTGHNMFDVRLKVIVRGRAWLIRKVAMEVVLVRSAHLNRRREGSFCSRHACAQHIHDAVAAAAVAGARALVCTFSFFRLCIAQLPRTHGNNRADNYVLFCDKLSCVRTCSRSIGNCPGNNLRERLCMCVCWTIS